MLSFFKKLNFFLLCDFTPLLIFRLFIFLIVFSVIFSLSFNISYAKVVINEVLNNPSGEERGKEWVELYNLEQEVASLSGCVLYLDDTTTSQKIVFNEEEFVDKFKVYSWDNEWLNNSGDQVRLECSSYSDIVSYGKQPQASIQAPKDGISFGRSPDGTGDFVFFSEVTPNEPNSLPLTPTSEPTIIITFSPTPTNVPTNTPTTRKTPAPSLKNTNSPTIYYSFEDSSSNEKVSNDEVFEDKSSQAEILGIRSSNIFPSESTPSPRTLDKSESRNFPILSALFIILGIVFVSLALYPILKKERLG